MMELFNNFVLLNNLNMKKSFPLYYLYCRNTQCEVSLYHFNLALRMPLNAHNLVATHLCECCTMPLVSALDVEIEHLVLEANYSNYRLN